ncbi:MAG: ribonuclease HI [Candidatus Riflebacteria bacterium]|nr:ribonuclease HI [Candidatus Riflebacteria bacterium]
MSSNIINTTQKLKEVAIFCDGACSGNPGPGGWGTILRFGETEKELSGFQLYTTNNQMELTACINGLQSLKEPCKVIITTDSQYLVNAFNKGWLVQWKKNGWRTSGKTPVKNRDLWETLEKLCGNHQIEWKWIKGHAGHPENERCDKLAVIAREQGSSQRP